MPGGTCTRCVCSGNIDTSVTGNCNNVTGECLKCIYNTTGAQCQWCEAGTYGNALIQRNCLGNNQLCISYHSSLNVDAIGHISNWKIDMHIAGAKS